jgi:hypothetical protein
MIEFAAMGDEENTFDAANSLVCVQTTLEE